MRWLSASRTLFQAAVAALSPALCLAQNVDAAMLLHPPKDSWPGFHGDYSGRRHSALTEITPANVNRMTLAWTYQVPMQSVGIKATPILVDGVLYFTLPDNIFAIDAR